MGYRPNIIEIVIIIVIIIIIINATYPRLVSAPPDLEDWVALLNGQSL